MKLKKYASLTLWISFVLVALLSGTPVASGQTPNPDSREEAQKAIQQAQKTLNKTQNPRAVRNALENLTSVRNRKITEFLINALRQLGGRPSAAKLLLNKIGEYGDPWATSRLQKLSDQFWNQPGTFQALMQSLGKLKDPRAIPLLLRGIKRTTQEYSAGAVMAAQSLRQIPALHHADAILGVLKKKKQAKNSIKRKVDRLKKASQRGAKLRGLQKRLSQTKKLISKLLRGLGNMVPKSGRFNSVDKAEQWFNNNQKTVQKMAKKQQKILKEKLQKRLNSFQN